MRRKGNARQHLLHTEELSQDQEMQAGAVKLQLAAGNLPVGDCSTTNLECPPAAHAVHVPDTDGVVPPTRQQQVSCCG